MEPQMLDPISVWHAEHADYFRLLELFGKHLAVKPTEKRPRYNLMIDIISYLRHYPDRFHHVREDVAFARLARRDPSLQAQIDRLTQEHRGIAESGDALLKCLKEAAEDTLFERQTVETAAANYLAMYRQHLDEEDREIVPKAAIHLSQHDWAAVAAAVPDAPDPLYGKDFEGRYRELRVQIALAACGQ
jgi:hemerythrin-like domain-containing protein